MKYALALIFSLLTVTAAAQVPNLPGDWKKLKMARGDVVNEVYLDLSNVTVERGDSVSLRTVVTYHRYGVLALPGGKATHGLRVSIHDCKLHYVGVVMNVVYSKEKMVDTFIGTKEDIFRADSDPLFSAEHEGACAVPTKKLKPTNSKKLQGSIV